MVVDNDRTVLELMQIRLEVAGYRCHIFRYGIEAIGAIKQMRPAAMIVDALTGEGDGFEVVGAIRSRFPDLHCPILMTSKGLTADGVRQALGAGAQNCLAEPFSGAEVVERIGRLLQTPHRPAPPPIIEPKPQVVYIWPGALDVDGLDPASGHLQLSISSNRRLDSPSPSSFAFSRCVEFGSTVILIRKPSADMALASWAMALRHSGSMSPACI